MLQTFSDEGLRAAVEARTRLPGAPVLGPVSWIFREIA